MSHMGRSGQCGPFGLLFHFLCYILRPHPVHVLQAHQKLALLIDSPRHMQRQLQSSSHSSTKTSSVSPKQNTLVFLDPPRSEGE